jgi:hypothetical protein
MQILTVVRYMRADYFALANWFDEDAALPPYDAELFELPHGRAERGYEPVSARL